MADRWTDEREPLDWRERQERAQRYRREEYGAQDYGSQDYGDRSFQPRSGYGRDDAHPRSGYGRDDQARSPVFGERQSGSDYTGPRYGAGGYYGYTGQDDRERGGRSYGEEGRERGYRADQGAARNPYGGGYGYGQARFERPRSPDEHAYRVAYGDRHPDHDGHYDSGRDDRHDDGRGRNFWERASDRVASWFGEMDYDRDGRRPDRDAYRAAHRGRGPSGYKRSDERISEEVHDLLTDDPWVDASGIVISVSAGEVTLSGTVLEREAKHRAERIVENLAGVTHVQNNLRVQKANPLTDPGRGFGDSASAAQMSDAATKRTN